MEKENAGGRLDEDAAGRLVEASDGAGRGEREALLSNVVDEEMSGVLEKKLGFGDGGEECGALKWLVNAPLERVVGVVGFDDGG